MYIGIYLHAINYTIFGFDNNCKVFKLFNSHTFLKIKLSSYCHFKFKILNIIFILFQIILLANSKYSI